MRNKTRDWKPDSKVQSARPKVQRPRPEEVKTVPPNRSPQSASIYGVLPVLEALRANARRVDKILIAEGSGERRLTDVIELARQNGVLVSKISRESLNKLVAPGANHQGIVAFAAAANYVSADEIFNTAQEAALIVVLDGVEDPRNLGAILRAVECSGADGVLIPERRAVGLTETVAKSSAGATEHVKVAKVTNINRLIEDLKERKVWVVGTSGDAKMNYTDWDWTQPSALVLGGEGSGLHRLVAENCDVLVKIPMYGKIESLNVSVAAGVILFEAKRQRVSSSEFNVPNLQNKQDRSS
ncbi:MAG: 23S rRNA (guanosine(2251)-2'-O)-methyltransferase RlmB [Saprospiraceae bacterium]|nr:23S rRNA (guanosine(2251)-2'-O)-methyltransferase RlmB [Pyrinomonadaceae bacterium]